MKGFSRNKTSLRTAKICIIEGFFIMSSKHLLKDEIQKLRRNFHLKLAVKRGLIIREDDLQKFSAKTSDSRLQNRCSRLSMWRRALFFLSAGK